MACTNKQRKKERKSKTLAPSFSRPPSLPPMLQPLPPPLPCRRSHRRRRRQHCCRFHVQLCLGSRERSAAALSEHSDAQHVVVASQPAARAVPDRSRDAHRRDAVGSAPAQYILHGNSRSPLPLTALAAIAFIASVTATSTVAASVLSVLSSQPPPLSPGGVYIELGSTGCLTVGVIGGDRRAQLVTRQVLPACKTDGTRTPPLSSPQLISDQLSTPTASELSLPNILKSRIPKPGVSS